MSETQKTLTLGVGALALAILALGTVPGVGSPDAFLDRGMLIVLS